MKFTVNLFCKLLVLWLFFMLWFSNTSANESYFKEISFTTSAEWISADKILINEEISGSDYSIAFQWWPVWMSEQVQLSRKYHKLEIENGDLASLPTTVHDTFYKVKVVLYIENESKKISPYSLVYIPPIPQEITSQIQEYLYQDINFQVDWNENTLLFSTTPINMDLFDPQDNVELYGRIVFWSVKNPYEVVYTPYNLITSSEYKYYNELSTTWVTDSPEWIQDGDFFAKMYIKWNINGVPFFWKTSRIKTELTLADTKNITIPDGITVLAMGQSNMLGSRKSITGDKTMNPKVFIQNQKTQEWEIADLSNIEHFPLRASYNSNNLAFHFSKRLQEETGKNIYLILSAKWWHSIRYWSIWDWASPGFQYFLKDAHESNIEHIDILLWHQGESDNRMSNARYSFEFDRLLKNIKSSPFWKEPFVTIVWELAETEWWLYNQNTFFDTLNNDTRPWTTISPIAKLPTVDTLHFSWESLVEIGYNYFWDSFIWLLQTCESNMLPNALMDINHIQTCSKN